jgi:hypothetical protein
MTRRLVAVALVVAAVIAVVMLRPDPPHRNTSAIPVPAAVVMSGTGGRSSWMCAAGADDGDTHTISIANPTDRAAATVVTSYGRGGDGAQVPAPAPVTVSVPAHTTVDVDAAGRGGATGSAVVEGPPGIAVTHRIVNGPRADQAACLTAAWDRWFFPAVDSQLGAGSRLWVFNPFPADANFDVLITKDDGVLTVPALQGVVVPAFSSRVLDLGTAAQRRDQFAASVTLRSGRVVAELVQYTDGTSSPRGVRMQPGVSQPTQRVLFADSEGADKVSERIVIYNPANDDIEAEVAVRPDDADPAVYPEPITITVPRLRYVVVELNAETRLPPTGARTVEVRTDAPGGLVAERRVVAAAGNAWGLDGGTADSMGHMVSAARWVLPRVAAATPKHSLLRIVNPDQTTIAVVELFVDAGSESPAANVPKVEVAPGRAVTVDIGAVIPDGTVGSLVARSNTAVVMEHRMITAKSTDFWVEPLLTDDAAIRALGELPNSGQG